MPLNPDGKRHIITILLAFLSLAACIPVRAQEIDAMGMTLGKMAYKKNLSCPDTVSILFCGDFMMHKAQIENAHRNEGTYDFSGCLSPVGKLIEDADLAVGNMEFTLGGEPFTGYPAFSAPESYPEYVAGCGMDVFLLANNHILDRGAKGASRTLEHYGTMQKSHGIRYTGCGKDKNDCDSTNPLYVRLSGIKVALVNFTYGTNLYTSEPYPEVCRMVKDRLERTLDKARSEGAEIIIALPHWGEEYTLEASLEQKQWAQWLADHGADLIIGTHPHVVQETGHISTSGRDSCTKSVPVIYSLGNAISNMSAKNTRIGLFVNVRLAKDAAGKATILPPEYIFTWCTLPGRLFDRHTTIPVKEYIGQKARWKDKYDYELMVKTYNDIRNITGIQDK